MPNRHSVAKPGFDAERAKRRGGLKDAVGGARLRETKYFHVTRNGPSSVAHTFFQESRHANSWIEPGARSQSDVLIGERGQPNPHPSIKFPNSARIVPSLHAEVRIQGEVNFVVALHEGAGRKRKAWQV